jgi:hypothetical protein
MVTGIYPIISKASREPDRSAVEGRTRALGVLADFLLPAPILEGATRRLCPEPPYQAYSELQKTKHVTEVPTEVKLLLRNEEVVGIGNFLVLCTLGSRSISIDLGDSKGG